MQNQIKFFLLFGGLVLFLDACSPKMTQDLNNTNNIVINGIAIEQTKIKDETIKVDSIYNYLENKESLNRTEILEVLGQLKTLKNNFLIIQGNLDLLKKQLAEEQTKISQAELKAKTKEEYNQKIFQLQDKIIQLQDRIIEQNDRIIELQDKAIAFEFPETPEIGEIITEPLVDLKVGEKIRQTDEHSVGVSKSGDFYVLFTESKNFAGDDIYNAIHNKMKYSSSSYYHSLPTVDDLGNKLFGIGHYDILNDSVIEYPLIPPSEVDPETNNIYGRRSGIVNGHYYSVYQTGQNEYFVKIDNKTFGPYNYMLGYPMNRHFHLFENGEFVFEAIKGDTHYINHNGKEKKLPTSISNFLIYPDGQFNIFCISDFNTTIITNKKEFIVGDYLLNSSDYGDDEFLLIGYMDENEFPVVFDSKGRFFQVDRLIEYNIDGDDIYIVYEDNNLQYIKINDIIEGPFDEIITYNKEAISYKRRGIIYLDEIGLNKPELVESINEVFYFSKNAIVYRENATWYYKNYITKKQEILKGKPLAFLYDDYSYAYLYQKGNDKYLIVNGKDILVSNQDLSKIYLSKVGLNSYCFGEYNHPLFGTYFSLTFFNETYGKYDEPIYDFFKTKDNLSFVYSKDGYFYLHTNNTDQKIIIRDDYNLDYAANVLKNKAKKHELIYLLNNPYDVIIDGHLFRDKGGFAYAYIESTNEFRWLTVQGNRIFLNKYKLTD